ncbi:alpha/beta hydrolase [Rhodococcus marinonascens]|uniref:alpha/beta hydrolase n=1 Tax=Rhodococcus marinonascens TaxID=38311 RepID=UPI000935004F|nr:alpha/beta hydrolase [Rhodococcus marinonascens]
MPFFDGHSGRVHYRHWTAVGQPVAQLVFLHGLGQHTGHYHRFARGANAARIGVWGLDQAGHGLSEGDHPGPVADLAEDAALLTQLAAEPARDVPLVLMGHSLGAAVAMELLLRHGLGFRSAVLCGTPKDAAVPQTADALRALKMPLLAVHGVDDRIAPIDPVRVWAAEIVNLELREFEHAGHDLLHEKIHHTVTEVVRDFVLDPTAG